MTGRDPDLCAFCGRPADERHHFTARASFDGPYLDPGSTLPLCRRCHVTEGQLWREVGLDRIAHPLVARASRTAWTLGRLAEHGRPVPPGSVPGFHGVLLAVQTDVLVLVGEEVSA